MKKYGFGIVGCGVISKWHIDAIQAIDGAELIGVFDNCKENAQKTAQLHACRCFDTYEEMLLCPQVDIVSICTPSGTHAPLAIEAANRGKNIIVEKHMAIIKQQIDELIYTVEKNNVKLTVISQLRFKEGIQRVKNAIENGELGDIILGDIYMKYYRSQEYYDSSAWRGTWDIGGSSSVGGHSLCGEIKSYRDPQGLGKGDHMLQIKDFIAAIDEGREPLVNMYEGKKTVDIILAAYESSKTGHKVEL